MTISINTEVYTNREYVECGPIQDIMADWDETVHSNNDEAYKSNSSVWKFAAYGLLLVASFLLGRAYGWHEAEVFVHTNFNALLGTLR